MPNNYIINNNNFKNYVFFYKKINDYVIIKKTNYIFFKKYSIIILKNNKKIFTSKKFENIKKELDDCPSYSKKDFFNNFQKKVTSQNQFREAL